MATFLPPTLDGLVLEASDKASELVEVLRRLEAYAQEELPFSSSATGTTVDELLRHTCQAIGLVEGAQHLLEHVSLMRSRCVDADCR